MKVTSQTEQQNPIVETDRKIIDILPYIYVFDYSENLATTFADMQTCCDGKTIYETRTENYLIRFTFCALEGGDVTLCDMKIRGVASYTIEFYHEIDLSFRDFMPDAIVALIQHAGYKFDAEINRDNYVNAIHAIARKHFGSLGFIVQMV